LRGAASFFQPFEVGDTEPSSYIAAFLVGLANARRMLL
jgi:hypothetical protein